MHTNIERILKRANHILAAAFSDPSADPVRKDAIDAAYSKLNQGYSLTQKRPAIGTLPHDPDGAETVTAARFVAQAMGLRFVGHADLDRGKVAGPQDLVVLRKVEGIEDSKDEVRKTLALQAGMRIDILTQPATDLVKAIERRRGPHQDNTGTSQPSFL